MRILYSHRTRSADGQRVHIDALTDALAALGHDVLLAGPDGLHRKVAGAPPTEQPLDAAAGGTAGLSARLPRPLFELAEYAWSLAGNRQLNRAHRQHQPDILYERYNLNYLAGTWLRRRTGLPLLLEINAPLRAERTDHGGLALQKLAARNEAAIWRAADAVLPVTQALAADVAAAGVPEQRIRVIPNGIHLDDYRAADGAAVRQRLGLAADRVILGFTGFVRDWHGADLILDYLAARPGTPLHFLLIGDGPHLTALKEQALARDLTDRVTFTGVIQRADLPPYIAAFDIALQPRVTAYASPLKLFEYMAAGRAIAAPAQPNIREILADGVNALLFEPDHRAALYAVLDNLVASASLRETLGAAARRTIIDRDLTWASNARKVTAIAESLLAART